MLDSGTTKELLYIYVYIIHNIFLNAWILLFMKPELALSIVDYFKFWIFFFCSDWDLFLAFTSSRPASSSRALELFRCASQSAIIRCPHCILRAYSLCTALTIPNLTLKPQNYFNQFDVFWNEGLGIQMVFLISWNAKSSFQTSMCNYLLSLLTLMKTFKKW